MCFWFLANNSDGDDILLFDSERREKVKTKLFFYDNKLVEKNQKRANFCLADFVAPVGTKNDFIGGFLVTAGSGIETLASKFEKKNDDYNSILVKSIGDRIAEAFAEMLHKDVRTNFWGAHKKKILLTKN